jgi:membrane protease YdiL (CAAX protease family)
LSQLRPALGIAAVFLAATLLAGRGFNPLGGFMTFCQAILGLGLAGRIAGFKALPVSEALANHRGGARAVTALLVVSLAAVALAMMAGMAGTGVARLLGEVKVQSPGEGMIVPALWQLFFAYLAGAGIAEESIYRLVLVPLVWLATGRQWPAILVSGLLFGAYHLTPLSGMYLTFWQYPLTQFSSSAFIGMVWAWLFTRRGYEAAVLAHTLSNWLPVAVFVLFMGG